MSGSEIPNLEVSGPGSEQNRAAMQARELLVAQVGDNLSGRFPPNDGRLSHDVRDTRLMGRADYNSFPAGESDLITGSGFRNILIDNIPPSSNFVHGMDRRGYYIQLNPPNAPQGELQLPRKRFYYQPDLPSIDLRVNGQTQRIDLAADRQRLDATINVQNNPELLRVQTAYRAATRLEAVKNLPVNDPAMRYMQNMNQMGGAELDALQSVYTDLVNRHPNNAWVRVNLGDVMTMQAMRNVSGYVLNTLNRNERTHIPEDVKQTIIRQLDQASEMYGQARNMNGRWQNDRNSPFRSPYLPGFDFNPWAGGGGFLYWGTGSDFAAYRQSQVGVLRGLVQRNALEMIQLPPRRPEFDPSLPPNPSRLRIYERGADPSIFR